MEKFQSKKLDHEKVLYDPVHNYIHIRNRVILGIINSGEFQRLCRIRQLGPASHAFQRVTHTCFEHNLSVYELTHRIYDIFEKKCTSRGSDDRLWDPDECLLAGCAALPHDIGHGPYSHTFEHPFGINHEKMGQRIITDKSAGVNQALRQTSPNFPGLVANIIAKAHSNLQVVRLVSSRADTDRMDYLFRDAYFTGVIYDDFGLTRILEVTRPYRDGICFIDKGIHATEDYIIGCYQMYQQAYFHCINRSMEVILYHLLRKAQVIYEVGKLRVTPQLEAFLKGNRTLEDYPNLNDGVIETNFLLQTSSGDRILSDLSSRYLYHHPPENVKINEDTKSLLPKLKDLIKQAGFDPNYYTAANSAFDEPYDAYKPISKDAHSPIEVVQTDDDLVELSELGPLVKSLSDTLQGDERFFFLKIMVKETDELRIFDPVYQEFQKYIRNNTLCYLGCPNKKK